MAEAIVQRGFAPPPEVTGYWRGKKLRPAFSYQDVWGEEHAHAMTIAKATSLDVLSTFNGAIDRAIAGGLGFETFQQDILGQLKAIGITGPIKVADVEGGIAGKRPTANVDFTNARRLKVIFQSNMSSARAAGQWDRMQRTKQVLPFILYVRTAAADPRPEHLRWVGTILPIDDPFWRTHFPPNGWLCKCSVRQIGGAERTRLLDATKGADGIWYTDQAPPIVAKPWRNKRTGEVIQLPEGIDPGWHTNPGIARSRSVSDIFIDRLEPTPPATAATAIQRHLESDEFAAGIYRTQEAGTQRARLRSDGATGQEVDTVAPWPTGRSPMGIWPDGLASGPHPSQRVVTASPAAVGHTPDHHYAPSTWAQVPDLIASAEAWLDTSDAKHPDKVVFMRPADDYVWYLATELRSGRMEVVTLFRATKRYVRRRLTELKKLR